MKYIFTWFVFTGLLFASSLEEIVSLAIVQSTVLKQAKTEVAIAKLKSKESQANRFGEFNALVDATHYNIERTLAPLVPSAIASGTVITTSDTIYSAGVAYNVPLFTGFSQTRDIEISAIAMEMAEAKVKLSKEQIIYNVRSLYLSILAQKSILKAQKSYTQSLEKLTDQIAYAVEVGKKAKVELLKSRAEYQASLTKEAVLYSAIKTTKAALSALVGADVSRVEPIMIEVKNIQVKEESFLSGLERVHVEDMAILKADKMISKSAGASLPQVNLNSYLGKNYGEDVARSEWDDETLWQVGVNVRYNLLDFGKRSVLKERAKVAKMQAVLHKEQTLLDIKKQGVQALAMIDQRVAEYTGNSAQLALSLQSKEIEQVRYESGVSTLNDFLLAQSQYEMVMSKVIESRYNYQKSVYYLEYVLEKGLRDEK